MKSYAQEFIEFALQQKALLFGEFKLKSGRISPYFFNAGCFNTGQAISKLGQFYARAIQTSGIEFDVLFGPAYKGISLATTTAIALAEQHNIDKPYSFNRKEAKPHGEGGMIVGAPLVGRILVVDDVISAGKTAHEVVKIIKDANATLAGIVISIDREERGNGALSAVQEIENTYNVPVIRVAKLSDIINYLADKPNKEKELAAFRKYREEYGTEGC